MKVFICWSGRRSRYIAETLSDWLQQVLQAVQPLISSDIEKGTRWFEELSSNLEDSKIAIICLTNDNLDSKWIHFEAGAISKTSDAQACTFLYNVKPANVKSPLSQFQHTKYEKDDFLKLIKTINTRIEESAGTSLKEKNLEGVFEKFWPDLKEKLDDVPESEETSGTGRSDRELLEETLQIVRSLNRRYRTSHHPSREKLFEEKDEISDEKKETTLKEEWMSSRMNEFLNEKRNDFIDTILIEYAKQRNIPCTQEKLNRRKDDIVSRISRHVDAKRLIPNGEYLLQKVEERINLLPTF